MESFKTKSIFEITFPSLTCGKFDFSVDIESGTFRIDKVHFIGSPKINFSLLVYGGENTVNHDFYVYSKIIIIYVYKYRPLVFSFQFYKGAFDKNQFPRWGG